VTEPHLATLAELANQADAEASWPAASWSALQQTGALRWCIPTSYGGDGADGPELLVRYQTLASACLTTSFILSQREGVCRRLRDSGNDELCSELLPSLARGERFATVGMSQLTTSRQHVKPSVVVRAEGDAFVLDGAIPWVTGAAKADHILAGAVLEDGKQILVMMATDLPGVSVEPPLDLMALRGSITAEVRCEQVRVDRRWLLAGPVEKVLQGGRGGTGGLETSCLALGLTQAAIDYLQGETPGRPALLSGTERLQQRREKLTQEVKQAAENGSTPEAAAALRGRANALVLQATQTALTAAKGSGFLRQHPAQRWARQALFFLVWSCPWPAAAATLAQLTAEGGQACSWAP
jgi:alkylation response protein AidB-like acyl-CoA dehydrogenase